jgi:hypothetical protein
MASTPDRGSPSGSREAGLPITFRAAEGAVPVLEGAQNNNSDAINSSGAGHYIVLEAYEKTCQHRP